MAASAQGWSGSRRLLRRLRDIMAVEGDAQSRLDRIVHLIATEMVSEVCSVYILRAGEVLELYATEGLKIQAVHVTRLRVGEGLIGDIAAYARPVAAPDAWAHPAFVYRPETGEEDYRSLMGVPILRMGRVVGVLSVQNRAMRVYSDEEVETLETVAMVLAEALSANDVISANEVQASDHTAIAPRRMEGARLNPGLAIGVATPHKPRIAVTQMVAEDPAVELERLRAAVSTMHTQLDAMLSRDDLSGAAEFREVLESYRMFAEDRGWLSRIREAIRGGLTADAAVLKVQNDMRARMRDVADPYIRERAQDLEDLSQRLMTHLAGACARLAPLPEEAIIIARNMGPAELLDYDRDRLRGLVLEEGSPTSHVAIVARALDIPVLGRVKGLLDRVEAGDQLVVDADHNQIFVRPGGDVLDSIRASMEAKAEMRLRYRALLNAPTITKDGESIRLQLNAGLLIDMQHLDEAGADGVGLYRTEIPFMVRSNYPNLAAQTELYRRVLDLAGAKPVVFRTLDVGGDKILPYFQFAEDENPAMGWRAIRISLDRPVILRQQLRALVRAAAGRSLSVMFPMVSLAEELDRARALLLDELSRAAQEGLTPPARVRVGAMLEVPSLMWSLPQILKRVDFLSVGSNDLAQFFFAADRGSPELGDRFDPLSPPFLKMLKELAAQCRHARVDVTLCGEMGGRPLDALALLAIGFRSLSMSAQSLGAVKMMLRSLDVGAAARFVNTLLDLPDRSLRERLRLWAVDHKVDL